MADPRDTGDLLEVPEEQRRDVDPSPRKDPTHAALGDGGADDVSDVEEGEIVEEDFDDADREVNVKGGSGTAKRTGDEQGGGDNG